MFAINIENHKKLKYYILKKTLRRLIFHSKCKFMNMKGHERS